MALAHTSLTVREEVVCDYFVDNLDDPDIAPNMLQRTPTRLDEPLRVAFHLTTWTKEAKRRSTANENGQGTRRNRHTGN